MKDLKCACDICPHTTKRNSDLQFFYFPSEKQPERLNAWKRASNKKKLPRNCQSNYAFCENHFNPSDFAPLLGEKYAHIDISPSKKVLNRNAVPRRNLNSNVKLSYDDLAPNKADLVCKGIKAQCSETGELN